MRKFVEESWMILVLGVVFALLLGVAQTGLAPQIGANQSQALNAAIGQVVPDVASTELVEIEGYDRAVHRCVSKDGRPVGWAVDAIGMGFADKIRVVIGLTPDGARICGLKVIENVETPGLGNKIADDEWAGQHRGLDASNAVSVVKRPPTAGRNEIQAVTGATISSKAVADIVNSALERVRPKLMEPAAKGEGAANG